jgi:hypothetical protein
MKAQSEYFVCRHLKEYMQINTLDNKFIQIELKYIDVGFLPFRLKMALRADL